MGMSTKVAWLTIFLGLLPSSISREHEQVKGVNVTGSCITAQIFENIFHSTNQNTIY